MPTLNTPSFSDVTHHSDPADHSADLGQYMTPLQIARQMTQFVTGDPRSWMVLDPACGDGNLLAAACELLQSFGVSNIHDRLVGVDIDEKMVNAARRRIAHQLGCDVRILKLFHGDFLSLSPGLF